MSASSSSQDPPQGTLLNPQTDFLLWSAGARALFLLMGYSQVYDGLSNTTATDVSLHFQDKTTPVPADRWFPPERSGEQPRSQLFREQLRNAVVKCERCDRLYDRSMKVVDPAAISSNPRWNPRIHVMPYTFCRANNDGSCHGTPTAAWNHNMGLVIRERANIVQGVMQILSNICPRELIWSVFGNDAAKLSATGADQIRFAYEALRILWIRYFATRNYWGRGANEAFDLFKTCPVHRVPEHVNTTNSQYRPASSDSGYWSAHAPECPCTMDPSREAKLAAMHLDAIFGGLSLWGDAGRDLELLRDGFVTEAQIQYVYGLSSRYLSYMRGQEWMEEMTWVNAYACVRRFRTQELYTMMKRAMQRAQSAMERLEGLGVDDWHIPPASIKLGTLAGLRFRELHSALCIDPATMPNDNRVTERTDCIQHYSSFN